MGLGRGGIAAVSRKLLTGKCFPLAKIKNNIYPGLKKEIMLAFKLRHILLGFFSSPGARNKLYETHSTKHMLSYFIATEPVLASARVSVA